MDSQKGVLKNLWTRKSIAIEYGYETIYTNSLYIQLNVWRVLLQPDSIVERFLRTKEFPCIFITDETTATGLCEVHRDTNLEFKDTATLIIDVKPPLELCEMIH